MVGAAGQSVALECKSMMGDDRMPVDENTKRIVQRMLDIYGDDPQRWTQGAYARSEEGFGVSPTSPSAVCFCLMGAGKRATEDLGLFDRDFWDMMEVVGREVGECAGYLHFFNDKPSTTFDQAMAPLRSIARVAA